LLLFAPKQPFLTKIYVDSFFGKAWELKRVIDLNFYFILYDLKKVFLKKIATLAVRAVFCFCICNLAAF
jgi:hypothetical protein